MLPMPAGRIIDTIIIEMELMAEMPTARPSRPSMRLTALVQAMIHIMVNGMDSQPSGMVASPSRKPGFEMTSKTMPQRIATRAARNCPPSLIQGFRQRISSSAPMTAMITAPRSRPITCMDMLTKSRTDSTKPVKMASPPMRGIGWSWTRRASLGTSIAPTFSAKRLTGGVMR